MHYINRNFLLASHRDREAEIVTLDNQLNAEQQKSSELEKEVGL